MKFGAVIDLLQDVNVDMRDAYWGYPHRSTDGDKELIILVDGKEFTPASATVVDGRIIVMVVEADRP